MPWAKFSAGTPKTCHSAMAKAPPPHLCGAVWFGWFTLEKHTKKEAGKNGT